jgi:3-hydroxyacyl-CoA dehydrogenase/enoyl-CoA hydratase/3-hydroxybutyryl-CoA epimerase
VNEAARTLEEGIVRSARDGDIGAVFGIGFPPFRGGPFRWMDAVGVAKVVDALEDLSARFAPRFTPCDLLVSMARRGDRFYPAEGKPV